MQRITKAIIALLLTALVSIAQADEESVAAKKACACMDPVQALMTKMMAAMQSGDQAAAQRLEPEMRKIQQSSEACFERVKSEHPNIVGNQRREDNVAKKMEAICPQPGGWRRPQG